jgi:hypothetical protein
LSTVSFLRSPGLADLDQAAERTAQTAAAVPACGDGSGAAQRQAAAEAEELALGYYLAAHPDQGAYLEHVAELEAG